MLNRELKSYRQQRGLTQTALATKAGISLATIQNIEAGKANPELSTLTEICRVLGLELRLEPKVIDWESLIPYGLPLVSLKNMVPVRPHREALLKNLNGVCLQLETVKPTSREGMCLAAWLLALKDHYPSVWRSVDPQLSKWLENLEVTPSLIKLRRLALARVSSYL